MRLGRGNGPTPAGGEPRARRRPGTDVLVREAADRTYRGLMRRLQLLAGLGIRGAGQVARGIARGWQALRHPPGWYDEIEQVYGKGHTPSGRRSAGAAGLGGHISGGGG